MAKVFVEGARAKVEITRDPLDGDLTATCAGHRGVIGQMKNTGPHHLPPCGWNETYDDFGDATEYAGDHADGKR